MNPRMKELVRDLSIRNGASEAALREFALKTGIQFPDYYIEFMKESNGADGMIGKHSYLALFPIEDITQINEAAGTQEFAPGLILFADDGADRSYAFDTRRRSVAIVEVPGVGLSLSASIPIGSTFIEFLEYLYKR